MGALWERPIFREIGVNGECTAYAGQRAAPENDPRRLDPRLQTPDPQVGENAPVVFVHNEGDANSTQ
jgi:hypothetical protein